MSIHCSPNEAQVLVFSKLENLERNLLFSSYEDLSPTAKNGVKPRNSGFTQTLLSLENSGVFLLLSKYRREFFKRKLKTRLQILVFIFLRRNINVELKNIKGLYHGM